MWINRREYERLVAVQNATIAPLGDALRLVNVLREDLARERTARFYAQTRLAELKTEHAASLAAVSSQLQVAQTNFDWLTVQFNQVSNERALLLTAKAGLAVPAQQIALARPGPGGTGAMPDGRPVSVADLNLGEATADDRIFEDVGDQAAAALGLDKGRVYAGPEALLE
jgi:hypothetical protein